MAPISFRQPDRSAADLSDRELLEQICWRKSAHRSLTRAASDGDLQTLGAALRKHAQFSSKLRRGDRRSETCDVFLQPLWSLRGFEDAAREQQIVPLLKLLAETPARPDRKAVSRASRRILNSLEDAGPASALSPLGQLSRLTMLTWGSGCLNDEALARLWLRALHDALCSAAVPGDHTDPSLSDDQRVLVQGELPFLAGLVFQEVRGARRLVAAGEGSLRDELEAGTDNDGTPHSQLLDRFSLWLSPFCRAAIAGRRFDRAWWSRAAAARFSSLVLRSAALTRSTGEFALGNGVALAPASLLKAASDVAEPKSRQPSKFFVDAVPNDADLLTRRNPKQPRRAKRIRPQATRGRRPQSRSVKRSERPASQSDWAQLACLRNNWDLGADACVIAWNESEPRIDLTALGTAVVNGAWDLRSSVDDVPVAGDAGWECVCWFTDRDVDYIELRRADDQASVLRQAALSRTDHFLYLADTLCSVSDSTRTVEHAFELPLSGETDAKRDALTREWLLEIGALKVRVLPVSLEQDATIASAGELAVGDGAIRLQQKSAGPGLMTSLVLDWSPVRRREAAYWNRLTIAEDGRVLRPSEAAGIHLRLGGHQWLFYRSLVPGQTARTVLGQHTANEAIIGEMDSHGDLDPLVVVEAPSGS